MDVLSNKTVSGTYNSVDILKFILAVLVMTIHSAIDKTVISPVLRMAVPLFFIISSYFFFSKNPTKKAVVRMVKRNLLLYLFWSVVQLPLVIYARGYHQNLFPDGLLFAAKDILLGNGFTGSWYVMASVIATVVITCLSRKIGAGSLVLLTLPLYILCCFSTNYWNLLDERFVVRKIIEGYHSSTGLYVYTSFPVALFWVSIGRFLAEKKTECKTAGLIILCCIFAVVLSIERYLILRFDLATTDDCYFSLMLLCPVVFLLINRGNTVFRSSFRIRELSVLTYVTHGCVGRVTGYILKRLPFSIFENEIVKIVLTFFLIMLLGHIVLYLKNRRGIALLWYAC